MEIIPGEIREVHVRARRDHARSDIFVLSVEVVHAGSPKVLGVRRAAAEAFVLEVGFESALEQLVDQAKRMILREVRRAKDAQRKPQCPE